MAFALNHMTVPSMSFEALIVLAKRLGCVGVEVRNDLGGPLFDGAAPAEAGRKAQAAGLRILAVAEVKAFNDMTDRKLSDARSLMEMARACGAEAISLIPRNDGARLGASDRRDDLRLALRALAPLLQEFDLVGLIEPLGFETCALRHKDAVIEDLVAVAPDGRFKLIHDTFHHHLAGGGPVFADQTAVVHVSGVTDQVAPKHMTDAHRGLVDQADLLGNVEQLRALQEDGFDGPISMEAFAPSVHGLSDPEAALSRSFNFIGQCLAEKAA